jgi:hypothetical protein
MDLGDFSADALTDILDTAMSITKVAEYLRCVSLIPSSAYLAARWHLIQTHVITKPIEATLLSTGQTVQASIANAPVAWLDYAYRIRSRVLFREALIHSTGRYFEEETQSHIESLKEPVAKILKKKALMLKAAVKKAILNLLSFYPTHIQREKTVGRADKDSIGRASYANDIFDWLALVVLRHHFTHQVADDQTHQAQDIGKSVIDTVMIGGDAYLSKPNLEQWHEYFPMSNKANNVLENKLGELKESVKRFVTVSYPLRSVVRVTKTDKKNSRLARMSRSSIYVPIRSSTSPAPPSRSTITLGRSRSRRAARDSVMWSTTAIPRRTMRTRPWLRIREDTRLRSTGWGAR